MLKTQPLRFSIPLTSLLIASFFLQGCGDAPKDREFQTAPVTGKLLMGDKPLAGATVAFTPIAPTRGTGGYGVTDADGKFSADVTPKKEGLEPGTYAVTFTKWAQKDGSPIPEGKTAADVEAIQIIPEQFSNPSRQPPVQVATVPKDGANFDFQIPVVR